MPKGYYTGYSYCGIMPDGRKEYFVSDQEYVEAYDEELMEQGLHFFAIHTTVGLEVIFMANKKKPYIVFETKEDFDKLFEERFGKVHDNAKLEGFKDGCIWTLSYMQELFMDLFTADMFKAAEDEIRTRQIEKWRKDEDAKTIKEHLDFKNFLKNEIKKLDEEKP